jgi:hypothetical protein
MALVAGMVAICLPPCANVLAQSAGAAAGTRQRDANTAPADRKDETVTLDGHRYDLATSAGLEEFKQAVARLRSLSKEEKASKSDETKGEGKVKKRQSNQEENQTEEKSAENHSTKGTRSDSASRNSSEHGGSTHKGERDWSSKKVRNGLKALDHIIAQLQEIAWAVESNFVTPYFWRPRLEVADLVLHTREITLNASGRGNAEHPASNLVAYAAADLSKVDPKPSTFWSRPGAIAAMDLYLRPGQSSIPRFADSICIYSSPHKNFGVHPSFEVEWQGEQWKVKFGEERFADPFGSRIYAALGYHTEIDEYAPEVKVRWDRRILSKFNARRANEMRISLVGLPITTIRSDPYFDPFDFIQYAVMKDGSHVDAKALRDGLFPKRAGRSLPRHPETDASAYDADFENKIDFLVMKDASFTCKEKSSDEQEIGAWDYNSLGHTGLREVRGMAILDAWLDNWDVRWGNNRLKLLEAKDGTYRLEHDVADIGALFGNSSGIFRPVHGKWKQGLYDNEPNDYLWSFTHSQRSGKTTVPIRDYMTDSKIAPFYEMNIDDARWMARMIAQLSEEQIKCTLIASGFDASTARLLLEKLVARRDAMVRDLGLSGEIALLRPNGVNKRLSYNPETDGQFTAKRPNGQICTARNDGEYVIVKGMLRSAKSAGRTVAVRQSEGAH